MDAVSPARRDHFKPSVASGAGQRRRKLAVALSKERRDAAVRAKRMRRSQDVEDGMEMYCEGDEDSRIALENDVKSAVAELVSASQDISKGASNRKLEALKKVRRFLSCSSLPPVSVAVEAGLIPVLVECLKFGSSEEQLLEASWCLTNIAVEDVQQQEDLLMPVPLLIAHLGENSSLLVAEQCAWALGNFAGDSEEIRKILLAQGSLRPLARLALSQKTSVARTACWALSNLIKGPSTKGASDLLSIDGILPGLVQHLHSKDEDLVAETAWVLVYISALADTKQLINATLLRPLVEWLATSNQLTVLTPVLRVIGNIVCGDNKMSDGVIAAGSTVPGGVVGALVRCLQTNHRALQKEAAWVISNLAAGSMQHKEHVFPVACGPLVNLLATASFDVKKEAVYALGNLCVMPKEATAAQTASQPIHAHLSALAQSGCVAEFVNLVKSPDPEGSKLGLQFLELVMRCLQNGTKLVEGCDGMLAIEMLHFHENDELRNMANHLLDTYFGSELEEEEEEHA
ncbi:importin subunit alpha-9 [Selaginella moellendorffii]|uniref:importin subunit alpha-9 n=1 Tax=Selaginella moellendorffii TaxID=88036 RepID=UPI000D1CE853|nr:importin subunit alpha-9 [Selaginella moellendorffii]|eukprot:XP_002985897.2 importin subunit alpha-9 [Selaginella moellendorffii]